MKFKEAEDVVSDGSRVKKRRLGTKLRLLREQAGKLGEEAAKELEKSHSTISRIENGQVSAHPREVQVLLDFYGVEEYDLRESIVLLAREVRQASRKKTWWYPYIDVMSEEFKRLVDLEVEASEILDYESSYVPGLLQTEVYARDVFLAWRPTVSGEDIERLAQARIARQQVLTHSSPPDLWAVVDEAVLRRTTGGPDVMRAQLNHLLDVSQLPNVTLQVMPFSAGAYVSMGSSFMVFKFPDPVDEPSAYMENLVGGLHLEKEAEVKRCTLVFDHMRSAALSDRKSTALIKQITKDL